MYINPKAMLGIYRKGESNTISVENILIPNFSFIVEILLNEKYVPT